MEEPITVSKLLEHVGNLYIKVAQGNEKIDELEVELEQVKTRNSQVAIRFGNALAHLEYYNPIVSDKILKGENVPVEYVTVEDKPTELHTERI